MLLQAYDYSVAAPAPPLRAGSGGSDQWGNILSGVDLIRRREAAWTVHALCWPLLTHQTASKLGKTSRCPLRPRPALSARCELSALHPTDAAQVRQRAGHGLPVDEIDREIACVTRPHRSRRQAQRLLGSDEVTTHGPRVGRRRPGRAGLHRGLLHDLRASTRRHYATFETTIADRDAVCGRSLPFGSSTYCWSAPDSQPLEERRCPP